MPTTNVEVPSARHLIDDIIVANWDPTQVRGYDLAQTDPTKEDFLPIADSLDNVGVIYPSIVVRASQPGSTGGQSTYDFITTDGPGQNRTLSFLATVRAEDRSADKTQYVGDSASYSAVDAETIVEELITHIEDIVIENPAAPSSDFSYEGVQRPAGVPDDDSVTPPVRQAQAEIRAGNVREPT